MQILAHSIHMYYEWPAFSRFLQDVVTIIKTLLYDKWAFPHDLPFGKLPLFLAWIKEKNLFVLSKLLGFYRRIIILLSFAASASLYSYGQIGRLLAAVP